MENLVIKDIKALTEFNLNDLYNEFIKFLEVSDKTIETYRINLRQFLNYLNEQGITAPQREHIIAYKNMLIEKGLKATTIQSYLVSVKVFFKFLDVKGYYADITKHIKGVKVAKSHKKDYLLESQVKDILSSIDRSTIKGLRDYAMLSLMVTTGLRTIEVVRANIEDLRLIGNTYALYIQGKGKTDKDNFVKVTEPVYRAINKYLQSSNHEGALFVSTSNNNNGKPLKTGAVRDIVNRYLKETGLKTERLTAHSLRHTTATLNLLNGGSLEETRDLLRHESINTTLIYSHHLDRLSNQSEERLSNLLF